MERPLHILVFSTTLLSIWLQGFFFQNNYHSGNSGWTSARLEAAAPADGMVAAPVLLNGIDTLPVQVKLNRNSIVCFSTEDLGGPAQSIQNYCPDESFASYQFLNDTCVVITGEALGAETACIEMCDNNGICDTTILKVNVVPVYAEWIMDTIAKSEYITHCLDFQDFDFQGGFASILNVCQDFSGASVSFGVDNDFFCLLWLGLDDGKDTACFEVCDLVGQCDTIYACVLVVPDKLVRDTIFLGIDTVQYCFDGTLITGNIVELVDECPVSNGSDVHFGQVGNCIEYYGLQEGTDTICYKVSDDLGNIGFAKLIVTVQKTSPQTFCDSVFVLGSGSLCLDTTELPGTVTQMFEACAGSGSGHVEFFLEPITRCVFFNGLSLGKDSTCVVLCDNLGYCDTTYFCIQVVPFLAPPSLGDDSIETEKATPVVIDFAANDTIYGADDTLFILDHPISGQAILNLDNSFTYIPDDPYCDRQDVFTYVACTPNGCDTATVTVFIHCLELTVFNAVSPNNDGQNDYFHIAKIDEFPDNHLWIYNRWGQLVFDKASYRNGAWPLSWGDDTDLPDGTYYYILEWEDNGEKNFQRGFFELFR